MRCSVETIVGETDLGVVVSTAKVADRFPILLASGRGTSQKKEKKKPVMNRGRTEAVR